MNPTEPAMTNLRNRILKRFGCPGNHLLYLSRDRDGQTQHMSKRDYHEWLQGLVDRSESIEQALDRAVTIIEAQKDQKGVA